MTLRIDEIWKAYLLIGHSREIGECAEKNVENKAIKNDTSTDTVIYLHRRNRRRFLEGGVTCNRYS